MLEIETNVETSGPTPVRDGDGVRTLLVACRNGDRASRDRLVELSLPLVRSLARRYANRGERLEDLVQVGTVGLMEAIDRFDPARGEFLRFAVPTITGAIRHHLRDLTSVIRVPRRLVEGGASLVDAGPSAVRPLSLSGVVEGDARLEPALATDGIYDSTDDRLLLAAGFRVLRARERRILHMHFYAGLTQDEIARAVGISQVQVSRLIRTSLERMRAALEIDDPTAERKRALAAT